MAGTITCFTASEKFNTLEKYMLDNKNIFLFGCAASGKTITIENVRLKHPHLQYTIISDDSSSALSLLNQTIPLRNGKKPLTPFIFMSQSSDIHFKTIYPLDLHQRLQFIGSWDPQTLQYTH
jgi:hypothetical protein